jgi:hypothetical protein
MVNATPSWRLHKIKTDETADDTDYVGTMVAPAENICSKVGAILGNNPHPVTGIEIILLGATSAGVLQVPATMTVDLQVVGVFSRDLPSRGGTPGYADAPFAMQTEDDLGLGEVIYFPLNGAERFHVRIFADANDAVDNIEVWWRPVYR